MNHQSFKTIYTLLTRSNKFNFIDDSKIKDPNPPSVKKNIPLI